MKNREHLNIDYKKHVEYLPSTKKVLQERLEKRFGKAQGRILWVKTKRIIKRMCHKIFTASGIGKLPYKILVDSLYDSIACFA